ncbi:MAG: hypothetical protein DRH20_13560 [Deltaproteobacteria bacterium]|nr:MAG: hypothetical protein DRH20_13560 [Deltaproteobacteria bacterium]
MDPAAGPMITALAEDAVAQGLPAAGSHAGVPLRLMPVSGFPNSTRGMKMADRAPASTATFAFTNMTRMPMDTGLGKGRLDGIKFKRFNIYSDLFHFITARQIWILRVLRGLFPGRWGGEASSFRMTTSTAPADRTPRSAPFFEPHIAASGMPKRYHWAVERITRQFQNIFLILSLAEHSIFSRLLSYRISLWAFLSSRSPFQRL